MFKRKIGYFSYIFAAIYSILFVTGCGLFHSQRPIHSLQQSLRDADIVTIGQYGIAQDGTRIPDIGVSVLSKRKRRDLFYLLKSSNKFHNSLVTLRPDYILIFGNDKDRPHTEGYNYICKTGELGRDHEWCYVPAAFKVWMTTLPKPHHMKYKVTKTPYYDSVQPVK